jgi:predicted Rossmann fold nucleotide-binding protein DprA/Smf involved in DNA uptake
MSSRVFAVAGGRSLSSEFAPLVSSVCSSLVASGASLVVGCASGCDSFVLSSALSGAFPLSSVRCFAAFSASGRGVLGVSAWVAVSSFSASGGSVVWASPGLLSLPVPARLASRTALVVGAASAGVVVFFASPSSRGSLLACSRALSRGLPVVAFPCGFSDGDQLPSLGAGAWVACPLFDGAFVWSPSAGSLF